MSKKYKQLKNVKTFDDFIETISNEIETFDFKFIEDYMDDLSDSLNNIKLVEDENIQNKIVDCAKYIDKKCYENDLQRHLQTSYIATAGYLYSKFYDDVKDKSFDNMMLLSGILFRRSDDFYALQAVKYFDNSILDRIANKTDKFRDQIELMELVHFDILESNDISKKSIDDFVLYENNFLDSHTKEELLDMELERTKELFKNVAY